MKLNSNITCRGTERKYLIIGASRKEKELAMRAAIHDISQDKELSPPRTTRGKTRISTMDIMSKNKYDFSLSADRFVNIDSVTEVSTCNLVTTQDNY